MNQSSDGWFLSHDREEVHGPFTLAALVEATRAGNVVPSTQLRHESHTGGQWLAATRIRPIAVLFAELADPGTSGSDSGSAPAAVRNAPPRVAEPKEQDTARAAAADEAWETEPAISPAHRARPNIATLVVPDTLTSAMLALFDFRFRYFVTPWIIKISWGAAVALCVLWLLYFTFTYGLQPIVESASTDLDGTAEFARGAWEFQPPSAVSPGLARTLMYLTVVFGTGCAMLYLRVLLEFAIVMFRIAIDLGEVKQLLREAD